MESAVKNINEIKVVPRVKIGDRVKRKCGYRPGTEYIEGVVVYIHPERRYHAVEFTFDTGSFLECFPFDYTSVPQFI